MRTILGAVAGALTVGALLVSYNLGERHSLNQAMAPATQMVIGPDGVARPFLVQAGQMMPAQPQMTAQSYGTPYMAMATAPAAVAPANYGVYGASPQYVNERVVSAPVARRVSSQRSYATERVSAPKRSWKKSALLIGGSAGAGAGVGALIGGKKGAGIGALIGGGSAAIYDQVKRR